MNDFLTTLSEWFERLVEGGLQTWDEAPLFVSMCITLTLVCSLFLWSLFWYL